MNAKRKALCAALWGLAAALLAGQAGGHGVGEDLHNSSGTDPAYWEPPATPGYATTATSTRWKLPIVPPLATTRIVINSLSATDGTISITGFDDTGETFGPEDLDLPAQTAVRLKMHDLQEGNPDKGFTRGLGDGRGWWRLVLESPVDFFAAAVSRSQDGHISSLGAGTKQGGSAQTVDGSSVTR